MHSNRLEPPGRPLYLPILYSTLYRFIILQTIYAPLSSLVRFLNLSEGISISTNLYSKQLIIQCVWIIAFLFLGLKVYLGLNLSWENSLSSYLKYHINLSFQPYSSSSLFNFAWSILFAVGTSLSLFDKRKIWAEERFFLKRFMLWHFYWQIYLQVYLL